MQTKTSFTLQNLHPHVHVFIHTYHTSIFIFKIYDHFQKTCNKQCQNRMRGRTILAAPPIPLRYGNRDTYEDPRGIGGTPNTLKFESRDTHEGPPGYWRHRQYPSSMKIHIRLRGPGILAAPPIPSSLKVEMRMRGPRGIGGTANTLWYEIRNTYKWPPWYWRHRQYLPV